MCFTLNLKFIDLRPRINRILSLQSFKNAKVHIAFEFLKAAAVYIPL